MKIFSEQTYTDILIVFSVFDCNEKGTTYKIEVTAWQVC